MERGTRNGVGKAIFACFAAAVACSSATSGPGVLSNCIQNTAELDVQNLSGEDISIQFGSSLDGGLPNPLVLASGAEMDGLVPADESSYAATREAASAVPVQNGQLTLHCGVKTVLAIQPETKDRLSVILDGRGFGDVKSDPPGVDCSTPLAPGCYAEFLPQTVVTLMPNADPGSTAPPVQIITMDGDKQATVSFNAGHESIDVTIVGGAGTVVSSPAGLDCTSDYFPPPCQGFFRVGSVVTLSASPKVGSQFYGFTGGPCSGAATCDITIADVAPPDIHANFTPTKSNVTITKTGTGTGTISAFSSGPTFSCGPTCSEAVPYGTSLDLQASPDIGSSFVSWGGACAGSGTSTLCTLAVRDVDLAVTATFSSP